MAAQIIEKCEAPGPGWLAQGGALTSHNRGGTCKRYQKPFTGTSPEQKYCSGNLRRMAEDRLPGQVILFDQKTHRQWLQKVLQPAAMRANVPGVDMRALRRTALTLMSQKDPSAAARLARHGSTQMVHEVYNNAALERVRAAQAEVYAEVRKVVLQ